MVISYRPVAIAAAAMFLAGPVFAQSTTDNTKSAPQKSQGVPAALANPSYGGSGDAGASSGARKQQSQGVPAALANPSYGTASPGANGAATKQQ